MAHQHPPAFLAIVDDAKTRSRNDRGRSQSQLIRAISLFWWTCAKTANTKRPPPGAIHLGKASSSAISKRVFQTRERHWFCTAAEVSLRARCG